MERSGHLSTPGELELSLRLTIGRSYLKTSVVEVRKKEKGARVHPWQWQPMPIDPRAPSQKLGGDRLVESMQALPNGERKAQKVIGGRCYKRVMYCCVFLR